MYSAAHVGAIICCTVLTACATASGSSKLTLSIEGILENVQVDPAGDRGVFNTPIDFLSGRVVMATVEPPPSGTFDSALNLQTVVWLGHERLGGRWDWKRAVLERRTARDPWHTQASVAFDREGFVHVTYNMHNTPWQYSVSSAPFDIASFHFRGQSISAEELETTHLKNLTNFPTAGSADIPGNQVTYPAFFKDNAGNLFVTYRYSLAPAAAWLDRRYAAGVAKYDVTRRSWSSIGGETFVDHRGVREEGGVVSTPFAEALGWTVYLPFLAFGSDDEMHLIWSWRAIQPGMETVLPSYARSRDGRLFSSADGQVVLTPVAPTLDTTISGWPKGQKFYAAKAMAINPSGEPLVVLHPIPGKRYLVRFDHVKRQWTEPVATPNGAHQIIVDRYGGEWMFASGITIFHRVSSTSHWTAVSSVGADFCSPFARYVPSQDSFFLRAKRCDESGVSLYRVKVKRGVTVNRPTQASFLKPD